MVCLRFDLLGVFYMITGGFSIGGRTFFVNAYGYYSQYVYTVVVAETEFPSIGGVAEGRGGLRSGFGGATTPPPAGGTPPQEGNGEPYNCDMRL